MRLGTQTRRPRRRKPRYACQGACADSSLGLARVDMSLLSALRSSIINHESEIINQRVRLGPERPSTLGRCCRNRAGILCAPGHGSRVTPCARRNKRFLAQGVSPFQLLHKRGRFLRICRGFLSPRSAWIATVFRPHPDRDRTPPNSRPTRVCSVNCRPAGAYDQANGTAGSAVDEMSPNRRFVPCGPSHFG